MREKWAEFYSKQKNNIFYWGAVILLVDLGISAYTAFRFTQTGLCRNYMEISSQLHSCTAAEFLTNGWHWVSFSTAFLFIPAAIVMVVGTYVVDAVFAKEK